MNNDRLIKVIAIAALLWIFRREIKDFFLLEEDNEKVGEGTVIDMTPEETEEYCQHVIYQPFSPAGLHSNDVLPEGFCFRGDSYWDERPHTTGDAYADDQAEEFQKKKQSDVDLSELNSVTLILQNTTDEDIDLDVGDTTNNDNDTWGETTVEPYNFSDWFLPSKDELRAMYDNLDQEGVGDMNASAYWSSSEVSNVLGNNISFISGATASTPKTGTLAVRPIRTFTSAADQYSLRETGPGGGLIFYIDGTTYYEAAESDVSDGYYWSNITDTAIGTTGTAIGTGLANTQAIIAQSGHITSAAYASSIHADEFSLFTANYTGTQMEIWVKLPIGKTITIDWGDGTSEEIDGAGSTLIKPKTDYTTTGNYDVSMSGDIFYLTNLQVYNTDVSGDISSWSALTSLTILYVNGTNVSGDVSSWSALTSLTTLRVNNTSVSGDISSWSALTSLQTLWVYNTDVSGDISSWSALTSLTTLRVYNTDVSGDISSWSALTSLTILYVNDTSVDFDSSAAWAGHDHNVNLSDCALTSTQVDNALIAFDNGGSFSGKRITIDGTNGIRTAASDAAVASLRSNNAVNVNE